MTVLDADRIGPHALALGVVKSSSGDDVDFPAMVRTAKDLTPSPVVILTEFGRQIGPAEHSLRECRALVRTNVAQRVEKVARATEYDPVTPDTEAAAITWYKLVAVAEHVGGHAQWAADGSATTTGSVKP